MDKIGEIINRWWRVLEKPTVDLQKAALIKISLEQNINDFRYLLENVKSLEERLSAAQNPYSSQVGQAILWKDGELSYLINGSYLSVKSVIDGLRLLTKLSGKIKTITKEDKEIIDAVKKVVDYDFENLKKESKVD